VRRFTAAVVLVSAVVAPIVVRSAPVTKTIEIRLVVDAASPGSSAVPFPGSTKTLYLRDEVLLTNSDIRSVSAQPIRKGYAGVLIIFTDEGARKLAEITEANRGQLLAIVVDGVVVAAPKIIEKMSNGEAMLESGFSEEEAVRLAKSIDPAQ
jgi:preprotein translocase subunit SecD